ncbi:MAG: substrate-binding domain-containing protein [Akkermansiaceae bacterium]
MDSITLLTAVEQVAEHLRQVLLREGLSGTMPGVLPLAADLGVNHKTVKAALKQLEKEGLLVSQGPGRRRKIKLPEELAKPPTLRVAILCYEQSDQSQDYLTNCKNKLETAGHTVFYAPSHLTEIKMDVRRLARMVKKTEADAWVVLGGTREVLQWFMQQKIPVFADSGRRRKLKIAGIGPDHVPALTEATRRLIDLGHQRIVLLDSLYKVSEPGTIGAAFLDALSAAGITTSSYNMPGWEGGLEGLYAYLDSSFQRTSPTAIIAGSGANYFATQSFLVNRGIRVPQDLSLICVDNDPYFSQCQPPVSHIRWSSQPIVNRIVSWVRNISEGKEDTRQTMIKAEFVEGGTIGPVAKS